MNIDFKNIWVNLTVVLPGLVTYGFWRLLLVIINFHGIDFSIIDKSTVLSVSVLFAIALMQQAIAIFIEAIITIILYFKHEKWPNLYKLFHGRFLGLAKNKFNDDVLRTIGQFFLSFNISIGQGLILIFYFFIENPEGQKIVFKPQWLTILLIFFTVITICVTMFRCWNSVKVIKETIK